MNYGGRCRIFFKFWGNKAPNNIYPPLFFCCRQWRGASGLLLLERWSPQTRLKGTTEIRLMFSHHWFMGFLLDDRHQLPLLTKLHANILIRILLPQFLITVCVTHEGEHHILNDALKNKTKSQQGRGNRLWHIVPFICWLMLQPRLAYTLLWNVSLIFRRVAFIPGCVVWGFSTSGHVLCPGWCSSVSVGVLWEPHIAFPCTGIRLSEAPSRQMYKTKKTFIFKNRPTGELLLKLNLVKFLPAEQELRIPWGKGQQTLCTLWLCCPGFHTCKDSFI